MWLWGASSGAINSNAVFARRRRICAHVMSVFVQQRRVNQ